MLDIRHISIIDALPVYNSKKEILTVGCGSGELEVELGKMGYDVMSTDFDIVEGTRNGREKFIDKLNFTTSNILDLSTFPVKSCETVICSEVLEHIVDWKIAFKNLLELTDRRLIVTVPWRESFNVEEPPPAGHCNFWTDSGIDPYDCINKWSKNSFMSVRQFSHLAFPYHTNITKICTKYADWTSSSRCYMITVDKNQLAESCTTKNTFAQAFSIDIDFDGRRNYQTNPIYDLIPSSVPPPFHYGPPDPYQNTTGIDFIAFVGEDFIKNKQKLDYLSSIEYLLSDHGFRFCAIPATKEWINAIRKNAESSHLLTGFPSAGFINIGCAVTEDFMNILNSKNKFLIAPAWTLKNHRGVYSGCFDLADPCAWQNIVAELLK